MGAALVLIAAFAVAWLFIPSSARRSERQLAEWVGRVEARLGVGE